MSYNQEKMREAWKTYISRQVVLDMVRPEIARAWQRCRASGLDPWSADFPKHNKDLLQKKQTENRQLLRMAAPVLEYLMALFNCNISLSDKTGFVYKFVSPFSVYTRTYGTFQREETVGSGNVTIALREKIPVRVDGYEHYRAVAHNYSGVSAPMFRDREFMGLLNMNDPFRLLPDSAMQCCQAAAKAMIGGLAAARQPGFDLWRALAERMDEAVLVLDGRGLIQVANGVWRRVFAGDEPAPLGRSLGDFFSQKEILAASRPEQGRPEGEAVFTGRNGEVFRLTRRYVLALPEEEHAVFVLSPSERRPRVISSPAAEQTNYVGESPAWKKVDEAVRKIASHPTSVLILGDTGTGKEVVARAIHRRSGRPGHFVPVNCGAVPRELLASELFGYEGGAFTGARSAGAAGKMEYAEGGTLFLDEIGEMPPDMQVVLLRVLQEQAVTRLGSHKTRKLNVRVIAATNQDLAQLIAERKFRRDLYYRLGVFEIRLPLLRERVSDIPLLTAYFNDLLAARFHLTPKALPPEIMQLFLRYPWPGNVRELRNAVERLLIMAESTPPSLDFLPAALVDFAAAPPAAAEEGAVSPPRRLTREQVCRALEKHGGNLSHAARELHIARNTLYRKIEQFDIKLKVSARND
ncbi:MAG: sigma 54-interacting transcriptional regulator [Gracilibacteraceae bacterium]|nr:sigma 54-interacting transcriptional regulator [Gracilibacteraceae bacterium]